MAEPQRDHRTPRRPSGAPALSGRSGLSGPSGPFAPAPVASAPSASTPAPPAPASRASASGPALAVPLFTIVLLASLAAGAAGHFLAGTAGLAASIVVALFGAVVAAVSSGRPRDSGEANARALLTSLESGSVAGSATPMGWRGTWASLHERIATLAQERQASRTAQTELERIRRQIEMAMNLLREGKDPLTEEAELRVGPLRDLLQAAKDGAAAAPVVSRLPLGEEELIGADGEPLPVPWPAGADDTSPIDPRIRAEARRGLDKLIEGLADMADVLQRGGSVHGSAAGDAAGRSAAQLVDAVVHTAADGIEDLAAGLMRANELAGIAERVTNKATLLALNAALEATRSGSEAFAAIAEETRRLAEFAREATDTISRLSSEIEYKVGETITAIHSTSEDAKSAVAALSAGPAGVVAAPAATVSPSAVEALLGRARAVRASLESSSRSGAGPTAAPDQARTEPAESAPPGGAAPGVMLLDGLKPGAIFEG
jgi:hypothetical protein